MVSGGRSEYDQIYLDDSIDHVYPKEIPLRTLREEISNGADRSSKVNAQNESSNSLDIPEVVDTSKSFLEHSSKEVPKYKEALKSPETISRGMQTINGHQETETEVVGESTQNKAGILAPKTSQLPNNENLQSRYRKESVAKLIGTQTECRPPSASHPPDKDIVPANNSNNPNVKDSSGKAVSFCIFYCSYVVSC